ncbi:META domain-containing protein [Mangrovimonas sp. TPBH4]|uniref:META domain-containing protein n=1 Tax=Mangrovimonas sp. TPBH4 TaxID=1645914 RepID=UPI0018D1D0EF|nr:META domain-containing protein [Mangrovimonas sp. TPBH4]
MTNNFSLEGTWEANYIMGAPKDLGEIYPHGAPKITFDLEKETTGGQTGCNNFSAPIKIDGNSIQFNEAMAVTRKMCPDMTGEKLFLETLKKINKFSISEEGNTLNLIIGDIAAMRLHKL